MTVNKAVGQLCKGWWGGRSPQPKRTDHRRGRGGTENPGKGV